MFFYKTDSYIIVERRHEINAEVMDGRLELLHDNEDVYIVAHHPNKKWSYNIGWTEEGPLFELWPRITALGHKQKIDQPHLYYEAVPKRFYKAYQELFKFQDLQINHEPDEQKKPIADPKPNIVDLSSKTPQNIIVKKQSSETSGPRLQYPNEKAVYRYRPPNQKNS